MNTDHKQMCMAAGNFLNEFADILDGKGSVFTANSNTNAKLAIRDFLDALDKGRLPVKAEDFLIGLPGDTKETAYLTALREAAR